MALTADFAADWLQWLLDRNLPSLVLAIALVIAVILELRRPP